MRRPPPVPLSRLIDELRELPQGLWTPVAAGPLLLDVAASLGRARARIDAFFNLGLLAAEDEHVEAPQ
jgi:hypothetical protein